MKKKIFLLIAALMAMGQNAFAYDFSAVAPSGQRLFYTFAYATGGSAPFVFVTHPGNPGNGNPWGSYTKPTGNLTIPDSVTYNGTTYAVISIGNLAFSGCSGLTSVTIPNSVSEICSYSFWACRGLTSINIPNGVPSIGEHAFENCNSLTSITIPSSVTSIGNYAFSGCTGLDTLIVGNGLTTIGSYAFSNDSINVLSYDSPIIIAHISKVKLTSVTIGNSITSIPNYAFKNCSRLPSITIGNNICTIGDQAFYRCSSLDTVYMMSTTPPPLGSATFASNASGRVFMLNDCSSYDNYYTADSSNRWYQYRNALRAPISINVNVHSSDSTQGTADVVLGPSNSIVPCDSTAVVQATANYGYHFDHWSNGRTANPDTIALVGDSTIIAYFAPNNYAITGVSSDTARGSVAGSDTVVYLDTVTLIAHPNYGYHLDHWTYTNENNNGTSTQQGGDTLMLVATKARTATAYFAVNQYQLTVETSNPSFGEVYGGGTYGYLSTKTISATAKSGYHFDHWSNGSTSNPDYITLVSDSTLTAYFVANGSSERIDNVVVADIKVCVEKGCVYVILDGQPVDEFDVYDVMGRRVFHATRANKTYELPGGVYLVKVDDLPAQRVVVIR